MATGTPAAGRDTSRPCGALPAVLFLLAVLLSSVTGTTRGWGATAEAGTLPARDHGHAHGGLVKPALYLATGAVLSIWSHDEESPEAARRLLDDSWLDGFADLGNAYGDGFVLGGASLGVLAIGRMTDSPTADAVGGDLCETFLLASGTAWAGKVAIGRRRPAGGPHSFPSGHTTVAFSMVPVLGHHFGWRASLPALVLAGATALGRMEEFRHYQSDVLAGAALGLACGEIVAGSGFLPGRARPVALPGGVGVAVGF